MVVTIFVYLRTLLMRQILSMIDYIYFYDNLTLKNNINS